jgi:hypothetical protein
VIHELEYNKVNIKNAKYPTAVSAQRFIKVRKQIIFFFLMANPSPLAGHEFANECLFDIFFLIFVATQELQADIREELEEICLDLLDEIEDLVAEHGAKYFLGSRNPEEAAAALARAPVPGKRRRRRDDDDDEDEYDDATERNAAKGLRPLAPVEMLGLLVCIHVTGVENIGKWMQQVRADLKRKFLDKVMMNKNCWELVVRSIEERMDAAARQTKKKPRRVSAL